MSLGTTKLPCGQYLRFSHFFASLGVHVNKCAATTVISIWARVSRQRRGHQKPTYCCYFDKPSKQMSSLAVSTSPEKMDPQKRSSTAPFKTTRLSVLLTSVKLLISECPGLRMSHSTLSGGSTFVWHHSTAKNIHIKLTSKNSRKNPLSSPPHSHFTPSLSYNSANKPRTHRCTLNNG